MLANVLAEAADGHLRLSATNLELGITCRVAAEILEEGATTIPAHTFQDLVSTLAERIELALNGQTQALSVRSANTKSTVKCLDAEEFPPMPVPDLAGGIRVQAADFKTMIQQVAFAASADEARPVLTGVLFEARDDQLALAAADGFRLSRRTATLVAPVTQPVKALIPAKALVEASRVLEGEITIVFPPTRGQVIFHTDDVEVVSQLIEGAYPDLAPIIPKTYQTRITLTTAALLKACKQTEIFAREGTHAAALQAEPAGSLTISGQSAETGAHQATLEAGVEGSGGAQVALNVGYLMQALGAVKTPNVALETNDETSPVVIRPVGDDHLLQVLMPMTLDQTTSEAQGEERK